ncbi:hypothetical protein RJ55_06733 [Drechmeria coniospora]|nr:hypothetical protein RJ55_06733 [Drechmeria coniospora]
MVWKQIWPVVKHRVLSLFRGSLEEGKLPDQWRHAKIIPLKKPDKGDYSIAKAWRSISLLATLGKVLESVVAERISHAVETYGLLPTNHIGARKQRSAEQALMLLQEQIYAAWRGRRILSLVSFDVKGAYNVSPILFLFFNADLVQRRIDCYGGGSIAFVDDFTAWVTGPTAETNRDGIEAIIETALDWERRSGATFEADKTAIIHFARKSHKSDAEPFAVKDRLVQPKTQVKTVVYCYGDPAVDYASNVWMHACKDEKGNSINRVQKLEQKQSNGFGKGRSSGGLTSTPCRLPTHCGRYIPHSKVQKIPPLAVLQGGDDSQ